MVFEGTGGGEEAEGMSGDDGEGGWFELCVCVCGAQGSRNPSSITLRVTSVCFRDKDMMGEGACDSDLSPFTSDPSCHGRQEVGG